jgi:hypothetical protein
MPRHPGDAKRLPPPCHSEAYASAARNLWARLAVRLAGLEIPRALGMTPTGKFLSRRTHAVQCSRDTSVTQASLKMLRPPDRRHPAGEAPPGMAADPARAFSCFVVNTVHGI